LEEFRRGGVILKGGREEVIFIVGEIVWGLVEEG
jgi:hypothetical protein